MAQIRHWIPGGVILLMATLAVFVASLDEEAIDPKGAAIRPLIPLYVFVLWHFAIFVWLICVSQLRPATRVKTMSCVLLVEALTAICVGHDGFSGDRWPIFVLRWAKSDPMQDVVAAQPGPSALDGGLGEAAPSDSPAFRGADRKGIVADLQLALNWGGGQAPREMWRRPIGKGWASFAIVGDFCVTHEQRIDPTAGEAYEAVTCYDAKTGEERWLHRDAARLHDSMAGDGPRATPTIHDGRVYSYGATGILNCLDGATGKSIWSTNAVQDVGAKRLQFGMTGSPLVVNDTVVVGVGGQGHTLVAYSLDDGQRVWAAGDNEASYASPQIEDVAGVRQILHFDAAGLSAHNLQTGRPYWSFPWLTPPDMNNVCQPIVFATAASKSPDHIFISSGYGKGCAVLRVTQSAKGFEVKEVWSNKNLKSKFANAVMRDGYVYGLDQSLLTCIDLNTGKRMWKGGRYGYGQILLVSDTLLVQMESGGVALVRAEPDSFAELSRMRALRHRTWNQPAIAGSRLYLRNDREAVCYELPLRNPR